jgi:hypothetical protein
MTDVENLSQNRAARHERRLLGIRVVAGKRGARPKPRALVLVLQFRTLIYRLTETDRSRSMHMTRDR